MKALARLLFRYVFGSEAIVFILIFPAIIFGIMGEALLFNPNNSIQPQQEHFNQVRSFISGVAVSTVISSGLFLIPTTIVDFKNSVLMKRIGATNVKPYGFVVVVLCLFILNSTFSFFYTRTIATLIYGWRKDMNWTVAWPPRLGVGFLWATLTMVTSIAVGLSIATVAKTVRRAVTFSNLIYFPVSILSGGLIPIQLVYGSKFLRALSWLNPFKYSLDPYFNSQQAFAHGYQLPHVQMVVFPFVVIAFVGLTALFVSRRLRWTE